MKKPTMSIVNRTCSIIGGDIYVITIIHNDWYYTIIDKRTRINHS